MAEEIPEDIQQDLRRARALHERAVSDYAKCVEFSGLMADLLDRLEDAGCNRTADRVLTLLLDCSPKEGSHCDKATHVGGKMKKF